VRLDPVGASVGCAAGNRAAPSPQPILSALGQSASREGLPALLRAQIERNRTERNDVAYTSEGQVFVVCG
jgi:hypothetical protein